MPINNDIYSSDPGELLREYQTGIPADVDDGQSVDDVTPKRKKSISFGDSVGIMPFGNTINNGYGEEAREAGFGRSRYDVDFRPGEDIEHERAIAQSGWAKIGAGLTKMGLTSLTTFANTTAGTIWGAISAGAEAYNQLTDGKPGFDVGEVFDAGANNVVSDYLIGLQAKAEDVIPNYRTKEERTEKYQREWWKHINTANFIGDSFIKNLGFTIGAMAGGATWSRLALQPLLRAKTVNNILKGAVAAAGGDAAADAAIAEAYAAVKSGKISIVQAEKLLKNIENSAKTLNRMDARMQLFGAGISALGEGSTEGLMARKEFTDDFNIKVNSAEQAELEGLPNKILEEGDSRFYVIDTYEMPDGSIQKRKRLSEDGIAELHRRENNVSSKYQALRDYAGEKGEELASIVFALNIPILTYSNFSQFGRLFAGGWKTARRAMPVTGEINLAVREASNDVAASAIPTIVGEYASRGNKFLRGLGKSAKVAATESAEEMLQGVASSGAKNVENAKISAYNDDGFDSDKIKDFSKEWFKLFSIGGGDYLEDPKNWQEGFLGAVTGLLGMPSFSKAGWSGGIIGSAREAGEELDASKDAVNTLNSLIKSDEFQERWNSYIRGLKYSDQMDAALAKNDQYAWHTSYDNKLISDIMAFDKAGKLNDLKELAESYANISDRDIDGIRSLISGDESNPYKDNVSKMTNSDIVNRVKEKANEINSAIDGYKAIYDDLSARANRDTSPELLSEMLFTANQIKFFEKRFIDVLGKTITPIKDIIGLSRQQEKQEGKDLNAIRELEDMLGSITNFYTKSLLPFQMPKFFDDRVVEDLGMLRNLVNKYGTDEQKTQVSDLIKLSNARAKFYEKLATLQTSEGAVKFEQERMSKEKVEKKAETDAARAEVEAYGSLADVRADYYKNKKKTIDNPAEFIQKIRSVSDSNPYVSQFIDIYDTYSELRKTYIRDNGAPSGLESRIMRYLFDGATSSNDMMSPSKLFNRNEFVNAVRADMGTSGEAMLRDADMATVSEVRYSEAIDKISNAMSKLSDIKASAEGRSESASPEPQTAQSGVAPTSQETPPQSQAPSVPGVGTDPPAPASQANPPEKKRASLDDGGKSATDSANRKWSVGDTVYYIFSKKNDKVDYKEYKLKELRQDNNDVKAILSDNDGNERTVSLTWQAQALSAVSPDAEQALAIEDEKEVEQEVEVETPTSGELDDYSAEYSGDDDKSKDETINGGKTKAYYHNAFPEYTSESLKAYRETQPGSDARKVAVKNLESLTDKFKDNSFMRKLNSENAFINTVTNVEIGDKVKFISFADVELDKGKPVIYSAVEKGDKLYVYNVVRRNGLRNNDGSEKYEGLESFVDAFDKEYNEFISANPNQNFVFSKESIVWAKQPGIIEYKKDGDINSIELPITRIDGYSSKAPIVWVNGRGNIEVLRGSASMKGVAESLINSSDKARKPGRIYYLANDGLGGYKPIALGIEHLTENNLASDIQAFNEIRSSLDSLTSFVSGAFSRINNGTTRKEREDIMKKENVVLHGDYISKLKKHLNLTKIFFNIVLNNNGEPVFLIDKNAAVRGKKNDSGDNKVFVGENKISELPITIAKQNISFDFYPAGSGESAHKNISSMIKNGFITSNATRLLPKNVDVYIERWDGKDFTPTEKQKAVVNSGKSVDDEQSFVGMVGEDGPELPPIPSSFSGIGIAPFVGDDGEFGHSSDNVDDENFIKTLSWDAFSDDDKSELVNSQYNIKSKAEWEMKKGPDGNFVHRTEEEKRHILECLGLL